MVRVILAVLPDGADLCVSLCTVQSATQKCVAKAFTRGKGDTTHRPDVKASTWIIYQSIKKVCASRNLSVAMKLSDRQGVPKTLTLMGHGSNTEGYMAEVTIRDVRKSYGDTEVLHGVDFGIEDGEFVVLVGPSGCGKSTLLRMIAGLEGISSGTIAIGDKVVNNMPPSQRDIAMVFQNYALYPHKSVASNMAFALKMARMDKNEIEERVRKAAEILGLTPYLNRYPRALSGGQRQRVAMGRAIVRNPKVFLFDEPLSNLDAKLRVQMRTEIRELHQRLATTTVYVTHDQIEAMTMADKIVVMQDGYIRQIGAPLDVYDNPANIFVAGFIGSPAMNMMAATVRAGDGGPVADVGVAQVPIPAVGVVDGQKVTIGVRPEHLKPADAGLAGTVAVIEPTGAETHLVVRSDGAELVSVMNERGDFKVGQEIHLGVAPEAVHVFDGETGEAIR